MGGARPGLVPWGTAACSHAPTVPSWPDMSASDARERARAIMAPGANVELAPTLEEALHDYLGRAKLRSDHNRRSVDGQIRLHMAKFLKRRLHTITKQEIRDLFTHLSEPRRGKDRLGREVTLGGTRAANHVMQSFRTIWNHARDRMMDGDLKLCPTSALELHNEEIETQVIEPLTEWVQQVARLDPIPRAAYRLLLTTGMRKTEALSLRWEQVQVDRIHLPLTKNGRPFDVPLEPEHRAILDQCRLGDGTPYHPTWVFPTSRGDARVVVSVPFGLRLMTVNLERQAVDVERDPGQAPAVVMRPQPPRGEFEYAIAQGLQITRLSHHCGEARQRRLRSQSRLRHQRGQPGRGTRRQPEGRIVAERVGVVVVAPTLGSQKHRGPQQ